MHIGGDSLIMFNSKPHKDILNTKLRKYIIRICNFLIELEVVKIYYMYWEGNHVINWLEKWVVDMIAT